MSLQITESRPNITQADQQQDLQGALLELEQKINIKNTELIELRKYNNNKTNSQYKDQGVSFTTAETEDYYIVDMNIVQNQEKNSNQHFYYQNLRLLESKIEQLNGIVEMLNNENNNLRLRNENLQIMINSQRNEFEQQVYILEEQLRGQKIQSDQQIRKIDEEKWFQRTQFTKNLMELESEVNNLKKLNSEANDRLRVIEAEKMRYQKLSSLYKVEEEAKKNALIQIKELVESKEKLLHQNNTLCQNLGDSCKQNMKLIKQYQTVKQDYQNQINELKTANLSDKTQKIAYLIQQLNSREEMINALSRQKEASQKGLDQLKKSMQKVNANEQKTLLQLLELKEKYSRLSQEYAKLLDQQKLDEIRRFNLSENIKLEPKRVLKGDYSVSKLNKVFNLSVQEIEDLSKYEIKQMIEQLKQAIDQQIKKNKQLNRNLQIEQDVITKYKARVTEMEREKVSQKQQLKHYNDELLQKVNKAEEAKYKLKQEVEKLRKDYSRVSQQLQRIDKSHSQEYDVDHINLLINQIEKYKTENIRLTEEIRSKDKLITDKNYKIDQYHNKVRQEKNSSKPKTNPLNETKFFPDKFSTQRFNIRLAEQEESKKIADSKHRELYLRYFMMYEQAQNQYKQSKQEVMVLLNEIQKLRRQNQSLKNQIEKAKIQTQAESKLKIYNSRERSFGTPNLLVRNMNIALGSRQKSQDTRVRGFQSPVALINTRLRTETPQKSIKLIHLKLLEYRQKMGQKTKIKDVLYIFLNICQRTLKRLKSYNYSVLDPKNIYVIIQNQAVNRKYEVQIAQSSEVSQQIRRYMSPETLLYKTENSFTISWNVGIIFDYFINKRHYFNSQREIIDFKRHYKYDNKEFPLLRKIIQGLLNKNPSLRISVVEAKEECQKQLDQFQTLK